MNVVDKFKEMHERSTRINAIKAMKKKDRNEEQVAELKQWNKEAIRNNIILATATLTAVAIITTRD